MSLWSSLFGGLKSEITDLIILQLKHNQFDLHYNPKEIANQLVDKILHQQSNIFNTGSNTIAHKLTLASYIIAKGINIFNDNLTRKNMIMASAELLLELTNNFDKYSLSNKDISMLDTINKIIIQIKEEISKNDPSLIFAEDLLKNEVDKRNQESIEIFQEYYQKIISCTDKQLAIRLAGSIMIKNDIILKTGTDIDVINGDDNFMITRALLSKQLVNLQRKFEMNGQNMYANGTLLWIMTLESYSNNETVRIMALIWNELTKRKHLLKEVFNSLVEDGIAVSEVVRNDGNYIPLELLKFIKLNVVKNNDKITFETYFQTYKSECAKLNSQLSINAEGISLIDLLDNEPIERAYKDRVNPKELAKMFVDKFDISTFGRVQGSVINSVSEPKFS